MNHWHPSSQNHVLRWGQRGVVKTGEIWHALLLNYPLLLCNQSTFPGEGGTEERRGRRPHSRNSLQPCFRSSPGGTSPRGHLCVANTPFHQGTDLPTPVVALRIFIRSNSFRNSKAPPCILAGGPKEPGSMIAGHRLDVSLYSTGTGVASVTIGVWSLLQSLLVLVSVVSNLLRFFLDSLLFDFVNVHRTRSPGLIMHVPTCQSTRSHCVLVTISPVWC